MPTRHFPSPETKDCDADIDAQKYIKYSDCVFKVGFSSFIYKKKSDSIRTKLFLSHGECYINYSFENFLSYCYLAYF